MTTTVTFLAPTLQIELGAPAGVAGVAIAAHCPELLMHRFVAMMWNQESEADQRQADRWTDQLCQRSTGWTSAFEGPGLRVLVLQGLGRLALARMANSIGVIIGDLFQRGHEDRGAIGALSPTDTDAISTTDGERLIEGFWGNYIAIWRNANSDRVTLIRDPSGAVGCFVTEVGSIRLACAHVGDIADLAGLSFSTDWNQVRAFLLNNYFSTKYTGLREVWELQAGERATIASSGAHATSWAWRPVEIASKPDRRSLKVIQEETREVVETCVGAWGRSRERILLQLSGGLDSSILLSLLSRTRASTLSALHIVNSDYEAYELDLARLAAKQSGVDLIERTLDARMADLSCIVSAPKLARPARQVMGCGGNRLVERVCLEENIDAVMAGHGGDTLFFQRSLAGHALSDYLRLNGPGRSLLKVAYEDSTLQQRPISSIVSDAIQDFLHHRDWSPFGFLETSDPHDVKVARHDAASVPKPYRWHHWLDAAIKLPPGKREQLVGFTGLYNYYVLYGYGLRRDAINPYLSQPIIELSLRTPTYQFTAGGFDRALQRTAFRDVIPDEVFRRTGKGLINHQLLLTVEANLPFLREFVLDGAMVKQDWIDRSAAEELMSAEQIVRGSSLMELLGLCAAEAWLHSWRHDGRSSPSRAL